MVWIKALNGNVLDVPDSLADSLVAQGHEAFDTEDEARGKSAKPKPEGTKPKPKATRKPRAAKAEVTVEPETPAESEQSE